MEDLKTLLDGVKNGTISSEKTYKKIKNMIKTKHPFINNDIHKLYLNSKRKKPPKRDTYRIISRKYKIKRRIRRNHI